LPLHKNLVNSSTDNCICFWRPMALSLTGSLGIICRVWSPVRDRPHLRLEAVGGKKSGPGSAPRPIPASPRNRTVHSQRASQGEIRWSGKFGILGHFAGSPAVRTRARPCRHAKTPAPKCLPPANARGNKLQGQGNRWGHRRMRSSIDCSSHCGSDQKLTTSFALVPPGKPMTSSRP